jgi:simple sugar transport system permease protein
MFSCSEYTVLSTVFQGSKCKFVLPLPKIKIGGLDMAKKSLTTYEHDRKTLRISGNYLQQLALIPVLVVLFIVGSLVNNAFLTPTNIVYNILQQSAVLGVLVIAELLILISGNFDLSIESTLALAPMFAGWLIAPTSMGGLGLEIPAILYFSAAILVGITVGIINGILVVKLKLNAFIVTLSLLILLRGVTLGITSGKTLYHLPDTFLWLGSTVWLDVPVSVWFTGILFVVAGLFLKYHRIGREVYAVGGNAEAARASGIRVETIQFSMFIVGGILAAIAGVMLSGRIGAVTANQGSNIFLSVMAACVIGGISLNGGRGTAVGACTGVILLGTVLNILTLSQIQSFWIDATYGLIIILALMMTIFTTERHR